MVSDSRLGKLPLLCDFGPKIISSMPKRLILRAPTLKLITQANLVEHCSKVSIGHIELNSLKKSFVSHSFSSFSGK